MIIICKINYIPSHNQTVPYSLSIQIQIACKKKKLITKFEILVGGIIRALNIKLVYKTNWMKNDGVQILYLGQEYHFFTKKIGG